MLCCLLCPQYGSSDEPASLVVQQQLQEFDESEPRPSRPGVVSWSPPQPNWNPWLGCNIDEGPLATVNYNHSEENVNVIIKCLMLYIDR